MTEQNGEENMKEGKEEWLTKTYMVCILATICCILWGSAFPCIKLGYRWWKIASDDVGTQILFAGYRFFLAGIITIILGSVLQKKVLYPKREALLTVGKLSAFQTIIQYFLFYVGLANTTGVKASIIEAMNVFFAILVAAFIFRQEQITVNKMFGCILGFVGVVLVNYTSGGFTFSIKWNGEGAILMSALSYAVSSALIKRYSKKYDTVMLSGYQFVFGGLVLAGIGKSFGGSLTGISQKGLGILIYLAFVSAIAYTIWGILLKYNPVSKVAVFGFINPIAGVVLSALILKETNAVSMVTLIALMLVSIGIYIVNWKKEVNDTAQ